MNLLNHFEKFQAPASPLRETARDFVRARGLPTRKDEDWKYTSLKSLTEKDYIPAQAVTGGLDPSEEKKIKDAFYVGFTNVVFVNGVFDKNLSQNLPDGLAWGVSATQQSTFADSLEALAFMYANAINTLTVKKDTSFAKPVQLVFWTRGLMQMSSAILQIHVGAGAKIDFIETHVGGENDYFSNSLIELKVSSNAKATLIKVQEESLQAMHVGRTRVLLEAHAEATTLTFSTGARLARHSLEVRMLGAGAQAQVHGLYAVTGSQHVDNDTTIDHLVGHCYSSQLYKGLLDGESRAVFNGKVLIRKDAQKANSEQLNNNLLLSRKAEVDSKPMLEIEADDVKASHGSTVGQMNQEELFYLLSRAIPRTKAISMLSYGFLAEVVERAGEAETQSWLKEKLNLAFMRLSTGSV